MAASLRCRFEERWSGEEDTSFSICIAFRGNSYFISLLYASALFGDLYSHSLK